MITRIPGSLSWTTIVVHSGNYEGPQTKKLVQFSYIMIEQYQLGKTKFSDQPKKLLLYISSWYGSYAR